MVNIKIITGSNRPGRFNPQISGWVLGIAKEYKNAQFELVDLADINLPFLDEAEPAMGGTYTHEHTKAWAKIVDSADGFIVVHPEYNHGVPAILKNALDFLWKEWVYKPVAFVSYGADGGGVRAMEHLRQIVAQLKMFDLHEHLNIVDYFQQLDENGKFVPTDKQAKLVRLMIEESIYWAEKLKEPRLERLQK